MNNVSIRKQKGLAGILFVLITPALFMVFGLAFHGATMMQDSARLDDALEAASLAIAALDDSNVDDTSDDDSSSSGDEVITISGSGSSTNRALATSYIQQYMQDMDRIVSLDITKTECSSADSTACDEGGDTSARYLQYDVQATTEHSYYFGNTVNNEDTFQVSSSATSRKYQDHAVDIVFVSDFSGSMLQSWNSDIKYLGIIDIIDAVTDELQLYNDQRDDGVENTVSFVPFSSYVSSLYETNTEHRTVPTGVTGVDDTIGTVTAYTLCKTNELYYYYSNVYKSKTVNNIFNEKTQCNTGEYRTVYPGDYEYYDEEVVTGSSTNWQCWTRWWGQSCGYRTETTTVSSRCYYKFEADLGWSHYTSSRDTYCFDTSNDTYVGKDSINLYYDSDDDSFVYELEPTTDFDTFDAQVSRFYPEKGTASYQGLIRGAQMADKGSNVKRLIIILSDGNDNSPNTTSGLVSAGMCSTITTHLDSLSVDPDNDGVFDNVQSKIAVIGFDYDVSSNSALQSCAGSENVYEAADKEEILSTILSLITEEIGHLH